MARFQPSTFNDIFQRLVARVVTRSRLTDLNVGGTILSTLTAVAMEVDVLNFQMLQLRKLWGFEAEGRDLDARIKDFNPQNVVRLSSAKATSTVVFGRTGTTGTTPIPVGSVVRIPGSAIEFVTTASGSIPNTFAVSGSIPVRARVASSDANSTLTGVITQMDPIPGVETVTNDSAITGGQTEETDSQLLYRYALSLQSLWGSTPYALEFQALSTSLTDYGRVTTANVVAGTGTLQGTVKLFIDDGGGTVSVLNVVSAWESVVASASGGELRLFLANWAIVASAAVTVRWYHGSWTTLTQDLDFVLNYGTGQITLIPGGPAAIPTTGLAAGEQVEAKYTCYGGLIREVQRKIDGRRSDRATYPGYGSAGALITVAPPTIFWQTLAGTIAVDEGYDVTAVIAAAKAAVVRYVNSRGIGQDVYLSELFFVVQSVDGVRDVTFGLSANVIIGEDSLARAHAADISFQGA